MIRLSHKNDIDDIISIWSESFGDSENDIIFFLDSRYIPENTVVYEHDGRVVSVLFLLDGLMHIDGNDYPAYYLYAACTSQKFRGKGIMGDMLTFSATLSASRNKYFIVLKPGEKSLFGYYERFGYKSVFTKKIAQINDFSDETFFDENINCASFSSRDNVFRNINYFKWDSDAVDFAVKHHEYYGGKCYSDKNGYILYSETNGILYIKENTFADKSVIIELINKFRNDCKSNSVRIELPYESDFPCDSYEISESGMILPLNEIARKLSSSLNNAYLNLALD